MLVAALELPTAIVGNRGAGPAIPVAHPRNDPPVARRLLVFHQEPHDARIAKGQRGPAFQGNSPIDIALGQGRQPRIVAEHRGQGHDALLVVGRVGVGRRARNALHR